MPSELQVHVLLQPDPTVDRILESFSAKFSARSIAQVAKRVVQCGRKCAEDAELIAAIQPGLLVCFVPVTPPAEAVRGGMEVLQLHVQDDVKSTGEMFRTFQPAHEAATRVHAAGGVVFFVCEAGQSRSGTGAISFLMRQTKLPMEAVLAHVISRKPNADPNDGFRQLLRAFEGRIAARTTEDEDPSAMYASPLAVAPVLQSDMARRLSLISCKSFDDCVVALKAAQGDYNVALDALLQ